MGMVPNNCQAVPPIRSSLTIDGDSTSMNISVVKIDALPSYVLDEIFQHCIPSDPLKYAQPNISQAPMLLGHICSFWRDVAFQNPFIWAHLHYVAYAMDPIGSFDPRDVEFLTWWMPKVGALAPHLRLAFKEDVRKGAKVENDFAKLADFKQLLVSFMIKAQYLNLDFHCRRLLHELLGGNQPLSTSNLHTLVIYQGYQHHSPIASHYIEEFRSEESFPVTAKQSLRRLLLEGIIIPIRDVSPMLGWSRLTHIHAKITISKEGWFSILRACENLEYGSFHIMVPGFGDEEQAFHPPKTLPHLKQLTFENYGVFFLQSFLYNIHLPALVGLRIDNFMPPSITRLHTILSSTPALRELHLGVAYTAEHRNSILIPGDLLPIPAPLRSVVPELRAIHFEGSDSMLNICTHDRNVVKSIFTGDWLQLGQPGNLLRRVHLGMTWRQNTIQDVVALVRDLQSSVPEGVVLGLRPHTPPWLWMRWEDRYSDFTEEFENLVFDEDILAQS